MVSKKAKKVIAINFIILLLGLIVGFSVYGLKNKESKKGNKKGNKKEAQAEEFVPQVAYATAQAQTQDDEDDQDDQGDQTEKEAEKARLAKVAADLEAEQARLAKKVADRKAEQDRLAQEAGDLKAEQDRQAEQEAEQARLAQEAADLKAEQDRQAEQEAEQARLAQEAADSKAQEAARRAQEAADLKAEQDRQAQEAADRQAQEAARRAQEAARRAQEAARIQAEQEAEAARQEEEDFSLSDTSEDEDEEAEVGMFKNPLKKSKFIGICYDISASTYSMPLNQNDPAYHAYSALNKMFEELLNSGRGNGHFMVRLFGEIAFRFKSKPDKIPITDYQSVLDLISIYYDTPSPSENIKSLEAPNYKGKEKNPSWTRLMGGNGGEAACIKECLQAGCDEIYFIGDGDHGSFPYPDEEVKIAITRNVPINTILISMPYKRLTMGDLEYMTRISNETGGHHTSYRIS